MLKELDIEKDNDVLTVTIVRGEQNLFSGAMMEQLVDALAHASTDKALRFMRLRSNGPNFCLGREREGRTLDELRAEAERIVRVNDALRSSPLVSVAEVRGEAAGFGAGLVAATDIAIASHDTTMSFPEILAGVPPTIVISWLAFSLPYKVAFEIVATGRKVSSGEAVKWGLLTEVVPPHEVTGRVDKVLNDLRSRNTDGLRDIKRFFGQVRALDPVSAARASIDPLALASLRLVRQADHRLPGSRQG